LVDRKICSNTGVFFRKNEVDDPGKCVKFLHNVMFWIVVGNGKSYCGSIPRKPTA
jgi:hypothetical protein